MVQMAQARIGSRRPRVLVVGGDRRQRLHRERFERLAVEWNFDGEWLVANYDSPQKIVHTIHARIKSGLDVLTLLHWNKKAVTKAGLKLARKYGVHARVLAYPGFVHLKKHLAGLMNRELQEAGAPRT